MMCPLGNSDHNFLLVSLIANPTLSQCIIKICGEANQEHQFQTFGHWISFYSWHEVLSSSKYNRFHDLEVPKLLLKCKCCKVSAGLAALWRENRANASKRWLYSLSTDAERPAEIFQHFLFLFQIPSSAVFYLYP